MPRPSYCNVGPQKTEKPHALTLYQIGELDNAISHERVYIPSPTGDGLERVRNPDEEGVPVGWIFEKRLDGTLSQTWVVLIHHTEAHGDVQKDLRTV